MYEIIHIFELRLYVKAKIILLITDEIASRNYKFVVLLRSSVLDPLYNCLL